MADNLVSLEEAKLHLSIMDHQQDWDQLLYLYIAAASDSVRDVATDWDGTGEAPARIKLAVLARVAAQFLNREEIPEAKGELPMLTPLRTLEI